MPYLILTSLIWAASFGLIKHQLAGVDAVFVAWARLSLALVLFLPFLRRRQLSALDTCKLMAIGAIQYGVMYVLYIKSYAYLQGHEVALFTTLTPLHVVLIDAALERDLRLRSVAAGAVAVLAAAALAWKGLASDVLRGFCLVQAANLCFAVGQLAYRRVARRRKFEHREVFAWLYLGAVLLTTTVASVAGSFSGIDLTGPQLGTLLYLGLIASGLGFFLWNVGATRTSAAALAVMNNLKAPLAALIALTVFREHADALGLSACVVLLGIAFWLSREGAPRALHTKAPNS